MPKPVKYGLFLGVLGIIVGALLALVNYVTAPIIKEQELKKITETLNLVNDSYEWTLGETDNSLIDGVYLGKDENGDIMMYAYKTTTLGYKSGEIAIMTFIQNDKIVKVVLISMKDQTKGIGTQIENETYLDTFIGKDVSEYQNDTSSSHTKNDIDVISGATYSSRGVIDGVIRACDEYKQGGQNE